MRASDRRESRALRLLIQADHVPARVSKSRGDLGRVSADRLDDLAPGRGHLVDRVGDAVDHHVDEETTLWHRRPASYPAAAPLAGRIVEGERAVAAAPDSPPEHVPVEASGALDVDCRDLEVTDLPVHHCG